MKAVGSGYFHSVFILSCKRPRVSKTNRKAFEIAQLSKRVSWMIWNGHWSSRSKRWTTCHIATHNFCGVWTTAGFGIKTCTRIWWAGFRLGVREYKTNPFFFGWAGFGFRLGGSHEIKKSTHACTSSSSTQSSNQRHLVVVLPLGLERQDRAASFPYPKPRISLSHYPKHRLKSIQLFTSLS
jgi:hypothetical protein